MEKICTTCNVPKKYPEEFDKAGKYCKECHNAKSRRWRELNRKKYLASQKRFYDNHRKPATLKEKGFRYKEHFISSGVFYIRRQRLRNVLFIIEYFKTHPCVDCGNINPLVLEFDHVRGKKEFNIGQSLQRKISIERLQSEIDKCDVRCANCHTIKTAKERHYMSYKILHEEFLNSEEGILLNT